MTRSRDNVNVIVEGIFKSQRNYSMYCMYPEISRKIQYSITVRSVQEFFWIFFFVLFSVEDDSIKAENHCDSPKKKKISFQFNIYSLLIVWFQTQKSWAPKKVVSHFIEFLPAASEKLCWGVYMSHFIENIMRHENQDDVTNCRIVALSHYLQAPSYLKKWPNFGCF